MIIIPAVPGQARSGSGAALKPLEAPPSLKVLAFILMLLALNGWRLAVKSGPPPELTEPAWPSRAVWRQDGWREQGQADWAIRDLGLNESAWRELGPYIKSPD